MFTKPKNTYAQISKINFFYKFYNQQIIIFFLSLSSCINKNNI